MRFRIDLDVLEKSQSLFPAENKTQEKVARSLVTVPTRLCVPIFFVFNFVTNYY